MKRIFFLIMAVAMVFMLNSCQNQIKEEIRLGVCSRNGNSNIRGWVRFGIPVSSLSAKEVNILAEDISQIAETDQSPRAIKAQIKERLHDVEASDVSFEIKIGEKLLEENTVAIKAFNALIVMVLVMSPVCILCFKK